MQTDFVARRSYVNGINDQFPGNFDGETFRPIGIISETGFDTAMGRGTCSEFETARDDLREAIGEMRKHEGNPVSTRPDENM